MSKRKRTPAIESGWPDRPATDFGNRVGYLLAEKNMNLVDLAKKLGVSRQAVCYYKHTVNPSPRLIHKLANAFDVRVSYFFVDDWLSQSDLLSK